MPARASPEPPRQGDLRSGLIDAAERLMAERADWTFTLREVARAAGVSHNAPYNHFPDRLALLAALAARAFEDFRAALIDGVARANPVSAADRVVASARAYVAFALDNPSRFRLMFSAELAGCADVAFRRAGDRAFAVLRGLIDEGLRQGCFRPDSTGTHALSAWSMAHGLAILILDGHVPRPRDDRALAHVSDAVFVPLLTGLRAPDLGP